MANIRPWPVKAGKIYHVNIIYNKAKSKLERDDDTRIALQITEFAIEKLKSHGYDKSYYPDRDALPGVNIFDELFEVIEGSEFTIVIFTNEFLKNHWAKYCQLAAFKNLLDRDNSYKLIPILVGVKSKYLPKNLCTERYLSFTLDDWRTDEKEWDILLDLMKDRLFIQPTGQEIENHETAQNCQYVHITQESGRVEMSPYQRVNSQPASNEPSMRVLCIHPSSDASLQSDSGDPLQVVDVDGGPDEETSVKVPLTPPTNLHKGQPCPLQKDISSPTVSLKGTKNLTRQKRITPEGAPIQQGIPIQQGASLHFGTPLLQANISSNTASRQTPVPNQEQTDHGVRSRMVDSTQGRMDDNDLTMDNVSHCYSGTSVSSSDMKASDFVSPGGISFAEIPGSKNENIHPTTFAETQSIHLSSQDVKLTSATRVAQKPGGGKHGLVDSSDSGVGLSLRSAPTVSLDSLLSQESFQSETVQDLVGDDVDDDQTEPPPTDSIAGNFLNKKDNQSSSSRVTAEFNSVFSSLTYGLSTMTKTNWANVLRPILHSISNPDQLYLGNYDEAT